jgi:hypothetical protein
MIEDLEKSPRNSEGKSSALDPAVDIQGATALPCRACLPNLTPSSTSFFAETRSDSTDTEGFLAKGERVMAKLEVSPAS